MQISLKWVNELVNIEATDLDYLIEKLTLGGFEVEEILKTEVNNQILISLDISATANRSDSLSIQGISEEMAALLDKSIRNSKYHTDSSHWRKKFKEASKSIIDDLNCSTFVSVTVKNLKNVTSPKWLKQKLTNSGVVPENNLLDFQNYILLETGYPFELYDLDKIYTNSNADKFSLSLTDKSSTELSFSHNGSNYKLNDSTMVIAANDLPISIAGIVNDEMFSCSKDTESLLVEGSIFNAAKIRQQSRILGLRTNRSAKYEKSLKDTSLIDSCYRLVSLLRPLNPDLSCKLHTVGRAPKLTQLPIILKYENIKEILGPIIHENTNINVTNFIPTSEITNYLKRLNFDHIYDNYEMTWEVRVPYSRSDDIVREIDLVEEIGRLYGFDNFLTQLPKIDKIGQEDYSYKTRKKLTSCFLGLGLTELIQYSLVNKKTYVTNEIGLVNPLLKDCSNLRSSLLPNLIHTSHINLNQGNRLVESFEYGHVFSGNLPDSIHEKELVAGLFGGDKIKSTWSETPRPVNWFEAKGKLEYLFRRLDLIVYWKPYKPTKMRTIFHPYCTSEVFLTKKVSLGIFGKINPVLARKLSLPKNIYLFEFNFQSIRDQIKKNTLAIYREYASYPKIVKDLSFVVSDEVLFQTIRDTLYSNGSKFLAKIDLLDEYKSNSIPKYHTSLCLQFTFQSNTMTLQNKEIEEIMSQLQLILINKFGAIVRD